MGRIRLSNCPPLGRLVESGGVKYHLYETGSGSPTVVLEAGVGATSLSWALVQSEVSKFAHVVAYDRAGLGWSDLSSTPRTPSHIAQELRALLSEAGIAPPYILAGHSFGGLCVERFAIEFRECVAGVVLVDPLTPGEFYPLSDHRRHMLNRGVSLSRRGAMLAQIGVVRACLSMVLGGNQFLPKLAARLSSGSGGEGLTARLAGQIRKLPRELWPMIAYHWSLPKSFEGMARHLEALPQSCEEMSGAALPDIPVTVLLAAHNHFGAGIGLPGSARVVTAANSGHWIQLDEPRVVIDAILKMLPPVAV